MDQDEKSFPKADLNQEENFPRLADDTIPGLDDLIDEMIDELNYADTQRSKRRKNYQNPSWRNPRTMLPPRITQWDNMTKVVCAFVIGILGLYWFRTRRAVAPPPVDLKTLRERRNQRLQATLERQQQQTKNQGGSPIAKNAENNKDIDGGSLTEESTESEETEAFNTKHESDELPTPTKNKPELIRTGERPVTKSNNTILSADEISTRTKKKPKPAPIQTGESPTRKSPQKTKKSKHPPPIQMVCEALSNALEGYRLVVEDHPSSGTWGGVGWWKEAAPSPLSPVNSIKPQKVLRLRLFPYFDASKEDDLEIVCESVAKGLGIHHSHTSDDGTVAAKILPSDLRPLVACYNKLSKLSGWGHSPFLVPTVVQEENFRHFARLCQSLQSRLVQTLSKRIIVDAEPFEPDEDSDEEDDLFSDDYCQTRTSTKVPQQTVITRSPWDDFLDLLCQDKISLSLLRSLEKESPDMDLARRITHRIFRDMDEWMFGGSSSTKCLQTFMTWFRPLSQFPSFFSPVLLKSMREKELIALKDASKTGRRVEEGTLIWTSLVRAASMGIHVSDQLPHPRISRELRAVPNFLFAAYKYPPNREIQACLKSMEDISYTAQSSLVPLINAVLKEDKELVFEWIRLIVTKNKSLATMAKSDLTDTEPSGILAQSFTISFLLGFASALLDLCCRRLMDRSDKIGAIRAFDAIYLIDDTKWSNIFEGESHQMLSTTTTANGSNRQIREVVNKYSGSTDFFFLLTALLRVALYPALNIEKEQHFRFSQSGMLDFLRAPPNANANDEQGQIPERLMTKVSPMVCMDLGWQVQLKGKQFVTNITNFALLQLQWVLVQCKVTGDQSHANIIPDWIVKDPSRWLARVSTHSSHFLTQKHAEKAVEVATELLEVGHLLRFSPIVMTSLLRIATSFVRTGVFQAWRRQKRRRRSDNFADFDRRDQSIYLSFDKNDLGVTVFTNKLVCTHLCPTLIRIFISLDAVEGLDMDRDHDFTKLGAKHEIAELILTLWAHPNGACRQSLITGLSSKELRSFASSLAAALSMDFDDAVIKLSTIVSTIRGNKNQLLSRYNTSFIEHHADGVAGQLSGARRYLLLLCTLSAEPIIASSFGENGGIGDTPDGSNSSSRDLANMIVHFIDIITDQHGSGISSDIELELSEFTYAILQSKESVSEDKRSGQFCREEVGLDVLVVCHQLLSLAASWHAAGKLETNSTSSPILEALANHDDIDIHRWSCIFSRLENSARDGYRDESPLSRASVQSGSGDQRRKRRIQNSMREQMTHKEIDELLEFQNIRVFIDDLSGLLESNTNESTCTDEIDELERKIFIEGRTIEDEDYEDDLSDYVVSSSAFSSPGNTGRFLHYYDRTARSRLSLQTGDKRLFKEARKCHKNLPKPHSNSSCFVCFAEERMDLCRAIITGPAGTPYAHGIFQFDVYFPPMYPDVPPLVTFMTTGGGQVRFSVNLYNDGKVCLSLLGLTYAGDKSQRWDPQKSSLAQVLLSMQTQIFGVEEPFYNEGSGVPIHMRNTPAGRERSRKFNANIRLNTLRHAIVSHLRTPPLGFEEVSKRHFSMCRKRLLAQARRWMLEEEGNVSVFRRFERVYGELVQLLSPLTSYDGGKSLLPLKDDAAFVEGKNSSPRIETENDSTADKKAPASLSSNKSATPSPHTSRSTNTLAFNPWENPAQLRESHSGNQAGGTVEGDSDDEMYA